MKNLRRFVVFASAFALFGLGTASATPDLDGGMRPPAGWPSSTEEYLGLFGPAGELAPRGTVVADSGFRPYPNGFGFQNWGANLNDNALLFGIPSRLAFADYAKADIAEALFGESPRLFCDIAEWNGEPAGFAVWFVNFSTFAGRHGIYLEDLYVQPDHRGAGHGVALLSTLADICEQRGYGRLEWWVLDWNSPARGFYESIGAQALTEWIPYRVSGDTLGSLAQRSSSDQ
jgi:diamine N-acetyltransferase